MVLTGQNLALFALTSLWLYAQSVDSIRYVFAPVVVVDTSLGGIVPIVPTVVLSRQQLHFFPRQSVGDAIQAMPGVFIRNYGGLGGLKTVSLRGATAAQTVVILDGIRLNTVSNGLVDLGQIPSLLLEHMSIERGSRSAVWGSNAMGGAIVLQLYKPTPGTELYASGASFSTGSFTVHTGWNLGTHTICASADLQYTRGNYPFVFSQFGSTDRYERNNGDALFANAVLGWSWSLRDIDGTITALIRGADRGAPGPVLQGAVENATARLRDYENFIILKTRFGSSSDDSWVLRTAVRTNVQHYRDSLARMFGPQGADLWYRASDMAFVIHTPIVRLFGLTISPLAEVYTNALRGDPYRMPSDGSASRVQVSTGLQAAGKFPLTSSDVIGIESAIRGDYYSDVKGVITGLLQLQWSTIALPVTVRSSLGSSFRPPSFNELYYRNFGSSSLRPESSLCGNVGIVITPPFLQIELDGFVMLTQDQIIAVPRNAITWSAQNAGRVLSRGIELMAFWRIPTMHLMISGSMQEVTYNDPSRFNYGNQVVYTPRYLGMAQFEWHALHHLSLLIQGRYIGQRHTQTDNAPSTALGPITTFDVGLRGRIHALKPLLVIRIELLNALDVQYEVIRNFPMPGRSWQFAIQAQW